MKLFKLLKTKTTFDFFGTLSLQIENDRTVWISFRWSPILEFKFHLPYLLFHGILSSSNLSFKLHVLQPGFIPGTMCYSVTSLHWRVWKTEAALIASPFCGLSNVLPESAWMLNHLQVQIQYPGITLTMTLAWLYPYLLQHCKAHWKS